MVDIKKTYKKVKKLWTYEEYQKFISPLTDISEIIGHSDSSIL